MLKIPILISITESDVNNLIPKEFMDKLVETVITSPYLLLPVALAYISGHLWAYIILAYFSKRERKVLYSLVGKVGLGLIWFALVLIPIYIISYKNINITLARLQEIIITVLVISLALQTIILILVYFIHGKGQKNAKNH